MTLEARIVMIVGADCLTPVERAAMILAQPELKIRQIRVAVMTAVDAKRAREGGHGQV
jgi:hypothetical protein